MDQRARKRILTLTPLLVAVALGAWATVPILDSLGDLGPERRVSSSATTSFLFAASEGFAVFGTGCEVVDVERDFRRTYTTCDSTGLAASDLGRGENVNLQITDLPRSLGFLWQYGPRLAADGILVLPNGPVNLRTGEQDATPWPPNFHPTSFDGRWIYGHDQSLFHTSYVRVDIQNPNITQELIPVDSKSECLLERAHTGFVLRLECGGAEANVSVFQTENMESSPVHLTVGENDGFDGWTLGGLDASPDYIVAGFHQEDRRPVVGVWSVQGLAKETEIELDVPIGMEVLEIQASSRRWTALLESPVRTVDGALEGGFIVGDFDGRVHGQYFREHPYSVTETMVRSIPVGEDVLYGKGGVIFLASPGKINWPSPALSLLLGTAILAAVVAPFISARVDLGGARCPSCGTATPHSTTFCPRCGHAFEEHPKQSP